MTFTPVSGLLATVADLAEISPDAAEELVRLGLYESLQDQIDRARHNLEADALVLIEKQAAKARSHLLREYVGKALDGQKPADATQTAQHLAIIDSYVAKAGLTGAMLDFFNRDRSRDSKGRFAAADTLGHGTAKVPKGTGAPSNKVRRETAVRDAKDWLKRSNLNPDDHVKLVYSSDPEERGKRTHEERTVSVQEAESKIEEYLAEDEQGQQKFLVGIRKPETSRGHGLDDKRHGVYDAMSAFTGTEIADRTARNIPEQGAMTTRQTAANWNNTSDGSDRRSYRRMAMTGQALTNVSERGSAGAMVGGLAQLIGELGPEAENVLSPGFTRIAYRYRGTEKRPDAGTEKQLKEANKALSMLDPDLPARVTPERKRMADENSEQVRSQIVTAHQTAGINGRKLSQKQARSQGAPPDTDVNPVLGVLGHYASNPMFRSLTADQRAMRVRGDLVVASLVDKVPDPRLSDLSIESGQTPPSVGVMLDVDGEVVSEAMGFNGDHYLPFDLKNLKGLHGGQYVRTRTLGGPTTEDIYTGLLTGARQMQVVSNSGVYTVEFDPDLRGGRRYSDKASKMVERYGRILDAIGSNELYRTDLPGKEKAQLFNDAMNSVGWNKEKARGVYDEMLNEARQRAGGGQEFTGSDSLVDRIESEVDAQIESEEAEGGERLSNQQRANYKEDLMRRRIAQDRETAIDPYQLNGPGYFDALKALQTEFPYYIRSVKYEEMPVFNERRKLGPVTKKPRAYANDRGYTAPNANRATAEQNAYRRNDAKEGQGGRGSFAPTGATKEADRQVSTETASANRSAVVSPARMKGTAVNIGGVRSSIDAETKTLKEVVGPGSVAARKLAVSVSKLMNAISGKLYGRVIDKPVIAGQAIDPVQDAETFTASKYLSIQSNTPAMDFADWLMGKATPSERAAFVKTVAQLPDLIGEAADAEKIIDSFGGEQAMKAHVASATTLAQLSDPWAASAGSEEAMALARPGDGNPKPQPFSAVLELGDKLENYTKWEAAAAGKTGILDKVKELEGKSNEAIGQQVTGLVDSYKQQQEGKIQLDTRDRLARDRDLADLQQAWAFVHGKRIAQTLASGDLPKDPAGTPAQRQGPVQASTAWDTKKSDEPVWTVEDLAATYSRTEILAYLAVEPSVESL